MNWLFVRRARFERLEIGDLRIGRLRLRKPEDVEPDWVIFEESHREAAMPYVENRIVHDADSHLMELPDCLDAYLDPKFRAAYDALPKLQSVAARRQAGRQWANAQHDDPEFRAGADANILLRKNYEALGAFRREDRPRALDHARLRQPAGLHHLVPGQFRARRRRPASSPMRPPRPTTA